MVPDVRNKPNPASFILDFFAVSVKSWVWATSCGLGPSPLFSSNMGFPADGCGVVVIWGEENGVRLAMFANV